MTNPGFQRINSRSPPVKLRFLGFTFVVLAGGIILSTLASSSWHQLDRLEREHAAIKSESFYLGVTLRSSVRSLNSKLLQFGMSRDPAVPEEFRREAEDLRQIISTNWTQLSAMPSVRELRTLQFFTDLELLRKIDDSFAQYQQRTAPLLSSSPYPAAMDSFEKVYVEVQVASRELLRLCDQLVTLQGVGFLEFLSQTQKTVAAHKRLLLSTVLLTLILAIALAVIVYRGMISPLRASLSYSERIIERQEKLASLGVLASGVAHEIRNPLTAIKFRLFSLKKAIPMLKTSNDAIVVENEINRLDRIVKDFLRFARPSDPELRPVQVDSIITDVQQLMSAQLDRAGIELELELAPSALVQADPDQFKQVLINLVQNAAEAIQRNGRITVQTRIEDGAETDGRAVIVSVQDTGKGIPPEIEARLFDPFFSTKEGGTGLGLAIAARIVEKHHGILRYETRLNRGAIFEIVLPLFEHEPAHAVTNRG